MKIRLFEPILAYGFWDARRKINLYGKESISSLPFNLYDYENASLIDRRRIVMAFGRIFVRLNLPCFNLNQFGFKF